MRYFFSTGEASGEFAAVVLAEAIARIDPAAQFEGIGAQRMRDAGFTIWRENAGWASFGPFAAIPKIPKLYFAWQAATRHILESKPDVLILVDFGAFNVRLAQRLRTMHYAGAIVDVFPPGAWLDSERTARAVTEVALALTAFSHQHEFYAAHGLDAAYFGHPLASQYEMRAPREAPPRDGGTVAILPGSRPAELRHNAPALLAAFRELKRKRPYARAVVGAPEERIERQLRAQAERNRLTDVTFARGTLAAIAQADAAWVASGTAVLECALSGVPSVAMYIVPPLLERYVRRVYSRRFFTLPNLVLDREIVPEILQKRATAANLATAMDEILHDPQPRYAMLAELRDALGPTDALERCAGFIVAAARKGAA